MGGGVPTADTDYPHEGCGSQRTGPCSSSLKSPSTSFRGSRLGTTSTNHSQPSGHPPYLHLADNTNDGYNGQVELPQTESAKQPVSLSTVLVSDYTSIFEGYHGLFTIILSAKGHGLDMGELPVNLTLLLVFIGEGKIVGTDVRRPGMPPYITHLHSWHVVTTASRLTSS